MTEDIIKSIAEAEEDGAAKKATATENAAQAIKQAEQRAAEIEKTSGEVCKAYRETMQKQAEDTANKAYTQTLETARAEAREYCRKILSETDAVVGKIVGRIISGDC